MWLVRRILCLVFGHPEIPISGPGIECRCNFCGKWVDTYKEN